MDELTDSGGETVQRALAAERLRSARVLGLLRFVGISIACGLNLLLPAVVLETRTLQADVRLFACYWLAAAAVLWANQRSAWIARLVGLDIAVVDMPFVFLTGSPNLDSAIEAIELRAFRYLVKPVRSVELLDVMNKAVRWHQLAGVAGRP